MLDCPSGRSAPRGSTGFRMLGPSDRGLIGLLATGVILASTWATPAEAVCDASHPALGCCAGGVLQSCSGQGAAVDLTCSTVAKPSGPAVCAYDKNTVSTIGCVDKTLADFTTVQPYCPGYCKPGCAGEACPANCGTGDVCNDGVCQPKACGRIATWLDSYVHASWVKLYPFSLAAGQKVPTGAGFKSACTSSNARFGYAVRDDGKLVRWGHEPQQWGNSTGTVLDNPANDSIDDAVQVACADHAVIVLRSNGTVTGWGQTGGQWESFIVGTPPAGLQNVVSVVAGGVSAAALKADGTITMWGWDEFGTFSALNGKSGFKALAGGIGNAGGNFIAIKTDGTVVLAAKDFDENGSPVPFAAPPEGLTGVVSVAIGRRQALAVKQDGSVVAWGSRAAAPPQDLKPVVSVAVSNLEFGGGEDAYTPHQTLFALQVDGTVRAWGGIHADGLAKVASLKGINFLDSHGGVALYCAGSCGAVSPSGCCDGDNLHTCDAFGQDIVSACSGGSCGWQGSSQNYQCSTSGAPAPGNGPLQSCLCVPNCKNPDGSTKQCGSDGCGGACGDGTCDDGDPCTLNDQCNGAVCAAGAPVDCSDGNVCTSDSCGATSTYSTQSVCGKAPEGQNLTLTCPVGSTISAVSYAKTGTLGGTCPDLALGTDACLAGDPKGAVEKACLGKATCTVDNPVAPASSVPVTDGLAAHYDASDAASITLGGGSAVNSWKDLSGNGRDLSLDTKSVAPVYGAALINNRPAINFDGEDRQLVSQPFAITKNMTVFVALQYRTPDQWGAMVHHGYRDMDWSLEQDGSSSPQNTHFQSVNDNDGVALVLSTNTAFLLSGRIDGTTRTYLSRTGGAGLKSVSGDGNSIELGNKPLYVGSSEAMEDSNAYIGEVLYYDHALTDAERTAVLDWLAQKWQIDSPCGDKSLGVVATCTPSTASTLCGKTASENDLLTLSCPPGSAIVDIPFASYGLPEGTCPNVQKGTCEAVESMDKVKAACLGKGTCSIVGGNSVFGDPCGGVKKTLAVRAICAPLAASCDHKPAAQPCDDGNACTGGDTCQAGACSGGPAVTCDDGNTCTNDACEPSTGCKYTANTSPCSDGDVCTDGDVCGQGSCQPGQGAPNCDDGNPCTTDTCDASKGCQHGNVSDATACDDGSSCTKNDACTNGSCKGASDVNCDDGNPCTTDDCLDATTCAPHTAVADGKACSDGNVCHLGAVCASGQCAGWSIQACNDGNPCTDDACDPQLGCTTTNNTAPCSDNNICTLVDACKSGSCAGSGGLSCDDKNPCTTDSCDPKLGCQYAAANDKPCNDGNVCTQSDMCAGGACVGGDPKSCDDGLACTSDTCNAVLGCQHANNTEPCDDGDACTNGDSCWQGTCIGGGKPACNDGNACTNDSCDSQSGCKYVPNSHPCSDGNVCTVTDVCSEGSCKPGTKLACDDKNLCTTDSCAPSVGCVFVNNSLACDDGTACTENDACAKGACGGVAKNCDDKNLCTTDSCNDNTGCVHTANTAACNDGTPCTVNDVCANNKCTAGKPNTCDDNNPCTADYCEKKYAPYCFHDLEPTNYTACNDGSACTVNDICLAGACSGTSACQNAGCALVGGKPSCVCPAGQKQVASGSKVQPVKCCTPQCANKTCGDDGCGGTCGTCSSEETCSSYAVNSTTYNYCAPKIACYGKVPTDVSCCDGRKFLTCHAPNSIESYDCAASGRYCGWSSTYQVYTCTDDGAKEPTGKYPFKCPGAAACAPSCSGKSCGPDGCGGSCGSCSSGQLCSLGKGKCFTPCEGAYPLVGCVAQDPGGKDVITTCPGIEAKASAATQVTCENGQKAGWNKAQGRFVCGSTDTLPAGTSATCPSVCSCGLGTLKRVCGDDGCGNSCGTCSSGKTCATSGVGAGQCFTTCATGQTAKADGSCCTPSCKGCTYVNKKTGGCYTGYEFTKTCGDDGCGGSCGTCVGDGQQCTTAGICGVEACTKAGVTSAGTCTGNNLQYCTATQLISQDCTSVGGSCSYVPYAGTKSCAVQGPHQCGSDACNQNAAWSCQCDAGCVARGDCCDNFGATCGVKLAAGSCGDKSCNALTGEDCLTCGADCGACPAKTTASMQDAPYPRVIDRSGGTARAHYSASPLDDVRPSPPPLPTRGLLAYVPANGALSGNPNVHSSLSALRAGGTVKVVADGPGGSAAMSTRNGSVSTFGTIRVSTDRTWRGNASTATASNGGFTVAGWVRLAADTSTVSQALGSAQSVDWPDRQAWQLQEFFAVSRPKDSGLQVACPDQSLTSSPKSAKLRIQAIEAYYGEAVGPSFQPMGGTIAGVSGEGYFALVKTYACAYPEIQAVAEKACMGAISCTVDPWLAAGNPCASVAGAKDNSRLMVRYLCGFSGLDPVLNLAVEPASAGSKLRLDVPGQTSLRSAVAVTRGEWTHVAVVFEPSMPMATNQTQDGRLVLALNGKPTASATAVRMGRLSDWTWGAAKLGGIAASHPGACPACLGNGTNFDVAALADFDDLMLYDRALDADELKGLVSRPNAGVARVWPAVDARIVVKDGLWTTGGKPQLALVTVPQLRDAAASKANKDQPLRAAFDGLAVPSGAVMALPAEGDDLTGLSKWTLGAWVRVGTVTTGTTLLEWKQGTTTRLKIATGSSCGGRALEATFGDGTKLSQTGCAHVVGDGAWQFVAVTQSASGRRLELDGYGTTGTGSSALFNATDTGPRTLQVTSAAALGWAALFDRALTRDETLEIRTQGPSTWLSGAIVQAGSTVGPWDWAAYGNQSSTGKTDLASVVDAAGAKVSSTKTNFSADSAGAYRLVLPAKGQLAALDDDAMRRATVVQTILLPKSNSKLSYLLWQATAKTSGVTGTLAAEARLDCANGVAKGGANAATDCKVIVAQKTKTGYTTWASPTFTLSFDETEARVRIALAVGDTPAVTLGYQGKTAASKVVYTAAGVDHVGAGSAVLGLTAVSYTVTASVTSPAGDAFYVPGMSTAISYSNQPAAGKLQGVYDVRIYPRVLGLGERAATVQWGCAASGCGVGNRACVETPSSGAQQLTVAACATCDVGFREVAGDCVKQADPGQTCLNDSECNTGLCSRAVTAWIKDSKGDFSIPEYAGFGQCTYKTASDACKSDCLKLGKDCASVGYADKQGFRCQGGCAANFKPTKATGSYAGTVNYECAWDPPATFNDHCNSDTDCDGGLCVSRKTKLYGVTTDATTLTHGRNFYSSNSWDGYWWGPYRECPDKAGCAVASLTEGDDKVCIATTQAQCTSVNMQSRVVSGPKWDGATASGVACENCSSEQYSGQPLYKQAWTLMSPGACKTLYDNYFDLLTTKNGATGVFVGTKFYAKGLPAGFGGDILDQEPTLAILRRLILKDAAPTSLLTPEIISQLQKAGIGNDLIGWSSLSEATKLAYRRQFAGTCGWMGNQGNQTCVHPDVFPIGACNLKSYSFASGDYLKWSPPTLTADGKTGYVGNVATYDSAFFNADLNKPVCVPNKFPNGTTCPPPGKENDAQFSRPQAGKMCDSGFCAADSHVCDVGFVAYEKLYGNARNDGESGGGGNDLGVIALNQDQGALFRLQKADGTLALETGTTDHRNYLLEAHSKQAISLFGKTLPILDLSIALAVTPAAAQTKKKASYKQEFLILNVQPPSLPTLPKMSCGGSSWDNGEYSGAGCSIKRQAVGIGIDKTSKGKTKEGEHGSPKKIGAQLGGASTTEASGTLAQIVDASQITLASFKIPLPIQECPTGLDGVKIVVGRACFAKQTTIGPVPFKVEAELSPEASVAFGAELDKDTLEPAAIVTPAVGLALQIKGGIGGSVGPLEIFAGIKAAITIIELAFPVKFAIGFKQGVDATTSNTVTDLWKVQIQVKNDIEVTFLKLALGLFFDVGIGPFTFSFEYEFFEYEGIRMVWALADNLAYESKVDFKWALPATTAK